MFSFEECLDCGWKSSHKGAHFSSLSIGCLAFIVLLLLSPFLTSFLSIPYMIYGGIGILVIVTLIFLRHGIYGHKISRPSKQCPNCQSERIKQHYGLWE